MHSILPFLFYLVLTKSWEVLINNFSTESKSFATCSNTSCNRTFFCSPSDFEGEEDLLCPLCKSKMDSHHIVQCLKCESIVGFIEAEPGETPIVFTVSECSKCSHSGTHKQLPLKANYFPQAFV